ncbi:MAG: hypothetical protein KDD02_12045 [Phaeodactylibacter sp.]|nr:hypothetical protein [Phaeodactylibacter sp.]MCB9302415.1 sugar transporter [Lewinellaceae bacterium]
MKDIFLVLLLSGSALLSTAQPLDNPVHWTYTAQTSGDGEIELVFTANIEPGWYLYSQYIGDDGPVPTSIVFYENEGYSLMEETREEGHKVEGMDNLFGMYIAKFKEEAVFRQRVKVKKGLQSIAGYVEFMTCDEEKCLPPTQVEFTFTFE